MSDELRRVKAAISDLERKLLTEPNHKEHLFLRKKYFQLADRRDELEKGVPA